MFFKEDHKPEVLYSLYYLKLIYEKLIRKSKDKKHLYYIKQKSIYGSSQNKTI